MCKHLEHSGVNMFTCLYKQYAEISRPNQNSRSNNKNLQTTFSIFDNIFAQKYSHEHKKYIIFIIYT